MWYTGGQSIIDSLPNAAWYFAGTNSRELIFVIRPEMIMPKQPKTGRKHKYEVPSFKPVTVKSLAMDEAVPWWSVLLFEGSKGAVYTDVKCIRCVSCRTRTGFGNYVYPHDDIWLYIRRYENSDIKYYLSNAPEDIALSELDEAAALRLPIEQCFEECKGYLGMGHLECRSYIGFLRHMLFVMTAHLFTTISQPELKKRRAYNSSYGR